MAWCTQAAGSWAPPFVAGCSARALYDAQAASVLL